jgi:nucleotide-binding universal stress UspA family protein
MSFRDVAICISSLDPGYGLVAQASAIVEGWDAHLSCCAIGLQPMPVFTGGFAGGYAEYQALSQAAQESIFSFRARLNDYIQNKGIKVEMRETQTFDSALALSAAVFARYADLLIATMPATPDKAHHGEIIEGALFNAGRPILALPNNWSYRPLGKRILLAWDASREASRAIHDALPMLAENADVCIVTVDAESSTDSHGASPGLDIATHLSRHKLNVTVQNADSLGKPVGHRIVDLAEGFSADMIVMGGYRHPKLAQRILGGPSHFLVSKSPLPVFLSH